MSALILMQGTAQRMPLKDGSINTIITSPPYYGLRVYNGLEPEVWLGGSFVAGPGAAPSTIPGPQTWEALAQCAHVWEIQRRLVGNNKPSPMSTLQDHGPDGRSPYLDAQTGGMQESATCHRCGCWYGMLGAEPTVELYLWHTVLWLRECWRVLAETGVAWVNLGDSYSSGDRRGHGSRVGYKQQTNRGMNGTADPVRPPQPEGLQPGSLLLIPPRVALAAAADGWIVRQDTVYAKVAPMPESVAGWRWEQARCRCVTYQRGKQPATRAAEHLSIPQRDHSNGVFLPPQPAPTCPTCHGTGRTAEVLLRKGSWRMTRSHEYVFMLCKSMGYFSNGEAVREESSASTITRFGNGGAPRRPGIKHLEATNGVSIGGSKRNEWMHEQVNGRNPRSVLHDTPSATGELASLLLWLVTHRPEVLEAYQADYQGAQSGPGSVLTPVPSPLNLQHYAAFPPSLIEPLIRATCPERCCVACGAAWAPMITTEGGRDWHQDRMKANGFPGALAGPGGYKRGQSHEPLNDTQRHTVHGFRPTCACYCTCEQDSIPPLVDLTLREMLCTYCRKLPLFRWQPGMVLDPFSGASTTLCVARALGRHGIGIEASPTYITLSRERLGWTDLDAWHHGAPPVVEDYTSLPLFGGSYP